MKTFSPSEAAFEGFRVIRNHPGAVLAWVVAYILAYVVIGGAALALFGPQMAAMSQYSGQTTMPPEVALGMFRTMGLGLLVLLPLGLILAAVFVNAIYRPILRPQDKGLFYLKISGDEWRLVLLILAYFGLGILAEIVLVIALIILALLLTAALGAIHAPSSVLPHILLGVAVACLFIWVVVRLSLAAPMTFARRKLSVFGSWRVTKGKFWSLFGCYLLAWIFGLLIGLFGWIVSVCAGAVISGDWTSVSGAMMNPKTAAMGAGLGVLTHMFTLSAIVQILLSSLTGAISRVIMYAPMAAAYSDLTAPPVVDDQAWTPRSQGLVL